MNVEQPQPTTPKRVWIPQAQYYRENPEYREKRKKQWHDYQDKNRDVIKARARERVTCVCGAEHARGAKAQHFKSKVHHTYLATHTTRLKPLC